MMKIRHRGQPGSSSRRGRSFDTPKKQRTRRTKPRSSFMKRNGLLVFLLLFFTIGLVSFYSPTLFYHGLMEEATTSILAFEQLALEKLPTKKKTCVITISAMNNFGFVSALHSSVLENSPSIDCFVWFIGDSAKPSTEEGVQGFEEIKKIVQQKENFSIVTMDEMDEKLSEFNAMKVAFMFSLVELQTTLKPFAFQYIFKQMDAEAAIYLDNDIWVTDSLEEVQHHLNTRSVVLTPHYATGVPEDGKKQKDKNVLASGVFNFGFVAFSKSPTTFKFLDWWGERLSLYGFAVVEREMFYDQNWGMFIPAFFDHEDYYVIRDLRYNIAYWNLHERGAGLHMKNGLPYLENPNTNKDERVAFMHFSGMSLLEKYDMDRISRHQNRFTLQDFPRIGAVFEAYTEFIKKHNCLHFRSIPYGFNHFSDGTPIEAFMRQTYAAAVYPVAKSRSLELADEAPYAFNLSPYLRAEFQRRVLNDPFCSGGECDHSFLTKISFLDWMWTVTPGKAVDMHGHFYFSFLERQVWEKRLDLQHNFPDPEGADFDRYKNWFLNYASKEGMIEEDSHNKWKIMHYYHKKNHHLFHKQVKSKDDIGINIIGWHGGQFSIGISGTKIIRAAKSVDIPVNAIEIRMPPDHEFKPPELLDVTLTRSISNPVNFVVINAAEFWYPLSDIPSLIWESKYNIAYWAWELDTFKSKWIDHLKQLDEVWCPSSFVKTSIESHEDYDGTPIKVLPIPLEKKESKKSAGEKTSHVLQKILQDNQKQKPFVFLVAFDFHSFVERKNPEAAIRAFLDAFPVEQDVLKKYQLIVKSHFGTSSEIDRLKDVANHDPRVVFLNELLSESDNKALYEHQDCFVSLHRSEGYGMIILETLGIGIPVIATNYSGNVDFFKSLPSYEGTCTFPVPYNLIELEQSYGPYEAGSHWADPDHAYTVEAMRHVVKNDCKNKHGKEMAREMEQVYGSVAIGKKMYEMMSQSMKAIKRKVNLS